MLFFVSLDHLGQILPPNLPLITRMRALTWCKHWPSELTLYVMGNPDWNLLFRIFPERESAVFVQRRDSCTWTGEESLSSRALSGHVRLNFMNLRHAITVYQDGFWPDSDYEIS